MLCIILFTNCNWGWLLDKSMGTKSAFTPLEPLECWMYVPCCSTPLQLDQNAFWRTLLSVTTLKTQPFPRFFKEKCMLYLCHSPKGVPLCSLWNTNTVFVIKKKLMKDILLCLTFSGFVLHWFVYCWTRSDKLSSFPLETWLTHVLLLYVVQWYTILQLPLF